MKRILFSLLLSVFALMANCSKQNHSISSITLHEVSQHRIFDFNVREMNAEDAIREWAKNLPVGSKHTVNISFVAYRDAENDTARKDPMITLHMVNAPCLDVLENIVVSAGWSWEAKWSGSGELETVVIYKWIKEKADV